MKGRIFFDGGSRGNPGPSACAFVIRDSNDGLLEQKGVPLGRKTNNQAEYMGLVLGMERALELGIDDVSISGDSELVILQMQGKYKVKAPGLKPLHRRAKVLLARFQRVSLKHVRRDLNKEADALLNMALDLEAEV